jgi:hypothetical protein
MHNPPRTIHHAQFTTAQFIAYNSLPEQLIAGTIYNRHNPSRQNPPHTIHRTQFTAHNAPHTIHRTRFIDHNLPQQNSPQNKKNPQDEFLILLD